MMQIVFTVSKWYHYTLCLQKFSHCLSSSVLPPLIISTAIILSNSKAQGREEEPALQEMDACYCLWDDSVFQSGPLCSNPM